MIGLHICERLLFIKLMKLIIPVVHCSVCFIEIIWSSFSENVFWPAKGKQNFIKNAINLKWISKFLKHHHCEANIKNDNQSKL